jgi:long-chain acyl-CoA synthetase
MEITRVFDLLQLYESKYIKEDALAGKKDGAWRKYSSREYIDISTHTALGLLKLGFEKGDKIATITNNRPEWNFVDMGMAQIGVVHVPIYPTISDDEFRYILKHAEVKAVFVSDKPLYLRIKQICSDLPDETIIFTFNEVENARTWSEVPELGKQHYSEQIKRLNEIRKIIKPDDLLSIIYTSGTTGISKGVMLSHRNIISNFNATLPVQPLDYRHKALSFLPLSHVYERMMNYNYQALGISIYYAENMGTIVDNLKEIKANGFNSVPRLLETVFDKIMTKGKNLKGITRIVFFWAVNLGLKYEPMGVNGVWYHFKLKIARKLVFSKWQEALGGGIQIIVSGGSALQPRLARIFWAAGIPVLEGYGLTETSPVIAVNRYEEENIMFGTVGTVLECNEVKIAEDGEILCKGPNVMLGYYRDPEATRQVIDADGFFHTGDIGVFVNKRFLKITDRKKEIFKLSSGKYVAPQPIENKLKESIFIEQTIVVGENEKFASALLSPNFNFLHGWCAIHNVSFRDNQELIADQRVIARYQKEVDQINKNLNPHEQIKRFRLVCEEWTPKTGELSPTLKLKRNFILKKYQHIVNEIFQKP